jgi:hypothetical protein
LGSMWCFPFESGSHAENLAKMWYHDSVILK